MYGVYIDDDHLALPMEMDFPQDFRCPISMELMKNPVTISTGVTYERTHIEKWFKKYKKKTCPVTMQSIQNFDITPNHTLKRLIVAWQSSHSHPPPFPPRPPIKHGELTLLLDTIQSTPFKVSFLKKLRYIIQSGDDSKADFNRLGGVEVIIQIIVQILDENSDFETFKACEEAMGVLHHLSLSEEDDKIPFLSEPECMRSMAIMLQRGSAEARFYAISMFQTMAKANYDWSFLIQDQAIDLFKSLLELISDEIYTNASSCALQVLIEILDSSKKSRLKAIEAGAMCTLIELLPDSNRSKCEKCLHLIKILCECADGRLAFIEHGLGIAAVSKKILHISEVASKIGVKILWLICSFHPRDRVLEEMMAFGAVRKLLALLHMGSRSSMNDRVTKLFKLHGKLWMRYPCFPSEFIWAC